MFSDFFHLFIYWGLKSFLCRPWKIHLCIFSPSHNRCSTFLHLKRDPVALTFLHIHSSGWLVAWRLTWMLTQFTPAREDPNHFNFNRRTRALSRLISKLFAFTFVNQMWLNIETENTKGPHFLSKWFICSTTPAEEMETPNPKSASDLQPPHRQLPHACVTFQEMDGLWVWNLVAGSRGLELYRLIRL